MVERGDSTKDKSLPLKVMMAYLDAFRQFGQTERTVVAICDLEMLHDADFWTMIMINDDPRTPEVYTIYQSVRFALDQLPKLVELLATESDDLVRDSKATRKAAGNDRAFEVLSAIVIEEDKKSTAQRLILVFESIQGLYSASAQLLGEGDADLCLVSCDSGSDKVFDFFGLAKVVQCVKEILVSYWDKVVYFRENKTGRQLELMAQSLPIIERISEMRENGSIEREKAELLKRQVISSVTKFAEAGVTIPEIDQHTSFNPRQLMRPAPKLLVAPEVVSEEVPGTPTTRSANGKVNIDDPEFQKYMREMAGRFSAEKQQAEKPGDDKREEAVTAISEQKPGKGTYKCTKCGTPVTLDDTAAVLPTCPSCSGTDFRKV